MLPALWPYVASSALAPLAPLMACGHCFIHGKVKNVPSLMAGVAAYRCASNNALVQVVIEPKMRGAMEYTVSAIQSPEGCVVALPPSTVEVVKLNSDTEDHLNEVSLLEQPTGQAVEQVPLFDEMNPSTSFFSYGRKYSPDEEVRTHTAPKLEAKRVLVTVPPLCHRSTP